jgi:hypothetical protein
MFIYADIYTMHTNRKKGRLISKKYALFYSDRQYVTNRIWGHLKESSLISVICIKPIISARH